MLIHFHYIFTHIYRLKCDVRMLVLKNNKYLMSKPLSHPGNSAKIYYNYFELIQQIKSINKKCRIALISLANPQNNKAISLVNRHIKAIADSEKCSFVNLDNAHLWNPAATKAAVEFAHSMGLNTRKPLGDVAEILYSYEFNVLAEDTSTTNLVG